MVTAANLAEWEALAKQGFEPVRERKVFGVVAGKYALSVVLLADTHGFGDRLTATELVEYFVHRSDGVGGIVP
ncbi:MAG: hypothetical protein ACRDRY_14620 [Pseudonocardiaceae bacterium]